MRRHPVEVLSLLSGLLFIGFALLYIGADVNDLIPSAAVTIPLLLAGLGVAGILAAIVASDRSRQAADEAPVPVDSDPRTGTPEVWTGRADDAAHSVEDTQVLRPDEPGQETRSD